jgi:hypothetical protein
VSSARSPLSCQDFVKRGQRSRSRSLTLITYNATYMRANTDLLAPHPKPEENAHAPSRFRGLTKPTSLENTHEPPTRQRRGPFREKLRAARVHKFGDNCARVGGCSTPLCPPCVPPKVNTKQSCGLPSMLRPRRLVLLQGVREYIINPSERSSTSASCPIRQ